MLDLVDEAGNRTALPYNALESVQFNPSGNIIVQFHNQLVNITGRNLQSLYIGLTGHRVSRIESALRGDFIDAGQDQPAVTEITTNRIELCR